MREEFKITRQGKLYVLYAGLLEEAHENGLRSIDTNLLQVPTTDNGNVAVVKAVVEDEDGRSFSGIGDASPENVGRNIVPHIIRMAECVPLDSEILTRDGWKGYKELRIGESVLAYDVEADFSRWVPLQAVNVFDSSPLVRLSNASLSVTCTPDHSWPVALTGKRVNAPQRRLRKAYDLKTSDSLILSAVAEGGDHPLSERDAAILGWLATDGTLREYYVDDKYGRWGPYQRAHIDQSKPHYVAEIRALLGEDAVEAVTQHEPRRMPSGQVSTFLPASRFRLRSGYLRHLLNAAGISSWWELPSLVLKLSSAARVAMLDAMLKGDGSCNSRGSWVFGKKRKPGVMEAWELLATLEGHALGKLQKGRVVATRVMRKGRCAGVWYLKQENVAPAPVWCPTTELGTWYMRQDTTICITGNTRGKARALRDFCNVAVAALEELSDGEEGSPRTSPQRTETPITDATPIRLSTSHEALSRDANKRGRQPRSRDANKTPGGALVEDANNLIELLFRSGKKKAEEGPRVYKLSQSEVEAETAQYQGKESG